MRGIPEHFGLTRRLKACIPIVRDAGFCAPTVLHY
jgi:hypothetical protein